MKKQLHALKTTLVSLFSVLWITFSYSQAVEVDFVFTVTDANMTVQVGADVCPDCTPGDLLGAFFENESGQLQCAGYQEWSGDQLAIAVMASEAGFDNGMAAGETIQWVLYDTETDTDFLLDAVMNSNPPFSDIFVANGFGQILFPLEISSGSDDNCADDDALMFPLDCAQAVAVFTCSGTFNDVAISDACPLSCDSCSDCADDDTLMAPLDCAQAVAVFTCSGTFNDMVISDACPVSCDSCGGNSDPVSGCTNDDADNYNPLATEDDGSCIISGCMCDLSFNYDIEANQDNGSCVVLSGGCSNSDASNYSGDACAGATFIDEDCALAPPVIPSDWTFNITDANMTIQVSADAVLFNGAEPPVGSLIGVFYQSDSGELQCAGYQSWSGDQLAIAAWASEAGLDNGFAAGEEIIWGLQVNGQSFSADSPTIMNANPPFSTTFVANGFGQLLSATFTGDVDVSTDCAGVVNGDSTEDACGVCDNDSTNDNTTCLDCAGVVNGDSTEDACGVCDNDSTNDNTTCLDCAGVVNGDSTEDACGVCDNDSTNDNTTCLDCAGVVNGDAVLDNCGTCDADASNDCTQDCAGIWGGDSWLSDCGCVSADNSGDDCDDCAGTPNGNAYEDNCGVCDADASNDCQADCNGVFGGDAVLDNCGTCDADASNDCTQDCAGVWGGDSWLSDCGCVSADNSGDDCDDCAGVPNGDNWLSDCGCVSADNSGDDCDDCAGTPNGNAYEDECGTCDADASNDCTQDCAGVWGGDSWLSDCGCVSADNSGDDCDDCAGVPNGDNWLSDCGCVSADNSGDDCDDECGVPNGDSTSCADDCGVPNGDNSSCTGCTNPLATNYNGATIEDGSCEFEGNLVQIDFTWDAYVNENEFTVSSVPGSSEMLSGNATETTFQVTLDPGIYVVNITDQFGDGVINGNLEVTEIINGIGQDVELYPSSSFAGTWSETSIYFAVGGAVIVPGCMDDDALNYNTNANIDYLQECDYPAEPGPDWEVLATDPSSSHIIGLMPGSSFEVDGVDLTAGSFIGVFYTDDNGDWACGGFTEWDGPGSVGVISAQINDPYTTEKDGFDVGEILHFRVWSQDFGCEYSDAVNPTYEEVDFFFTSSDGTFINNGISGLTGFDVSNMAISTTASDYNGVGVSCNGATDGSIDVLVTGGTAPYTYSWSNGAATEDLDNIGAGTYDVLVTDVNGCTISASVEITESDALTLVVDEVTEGPHVLGDINEGFGSISITVNGGTGNYTYEWTASLADGTTTWENGDDIDGLFAGTYSVLVTDVNGCTISSEITVPFYTPSTWSIEETDCNHSIEVPVNADISIDYDAITYGDWIAASLDGQVVGMMMWNLESSTMTVFSESNLEGANFEWFIWNANEANVEGLGGDSDDAYYVAEATYDDTYPNEGDFACGGLSKVLDIVARTVYMQQIEIQDGWGMYSTFISPDDASLESVLVDVVGDMTIMKDETGLVYWPALGINTIGSLVDGEGYAIKSEAVNMLEISGDLVPSSLPIFMPAGWSFIGYLHQEPADAVGMMSSLVEANNLIIMKDGGGDVYWPSLGINNIDDDSGMMNPGQGFAVKVGSEESFSYPTITNAQRIGSPSPTYPLYNYSKAINTGDNMVIGIPLNSWNNIPEVGDEIAAYNSKGNLVGSVTFNGESTALTVWGDDPTTDFVEGLLEGENIKLEIWKKSDNSIETISIENWIEGSDIYISNGIAIAGDVRFNNSMEMGYELYSNFPNPFDSQTTISFFVPENGNVSIAVYDLVGNMVEELTNNNFEPGMYNLLFEADNIAQGTYFVRMQAGNTMLTKKMDVVK